MIYNPFQKLGIQPTKNNDVINDAFKQLKSTNLTEKELFELRVSWQDCLFYADSYGDLRLFGDVNYN